MDDEESFKSIEMIGGAGTAGGMVGEVRVEEASEDEDDDERVDEIVGYRSDPFLWDDSTSLSTSSRGGACLK